jgi:hypothetical protein
LGTEGYSPIVLAKAVRQASKASSFAEASDDLRELADVEISATHLQRLSERIGAEWAEVRDEDVEKFRQAKLERAYKEPPRGAAAVMLDGGVQMRNTGPPFPRPSAAFDYSVKSLQVFRIESCRAKER